MDSTRTAAGNKSWRFTRWLGPLLVYGISIACLVWVYHDFDWSNELPKLRSIHWSWIALAVVADVSVYISQAWRWNILLSPIVHVPLWRSVQAIYIGLFANEALPLRSGEAIRCYLQHYWSKTPFATVLSSALIERLIDGVWLIVGFGLSTLIVELPKDLEIGVWILTGLVVTVGLLIAWAAHRREEAHDFLERYRWLSPARHLVEGLHAMGRSRSFYLAAAASIPYLLLQVIPIFAMMRGYGVNESLASAGVVLVVLRLGTIIPGPPGNIGFFNAFAVLGLTLLGIDKQTAIGLSGVMFFIITVPLLIGGCIAVLAAGLNIRELQLHAKLHMSLHRKKQHDAVSPGAGND